MSEQFQSLLNVINESHSKRPLGRLLFYGIGNIGREDDGLGIRFIENLEALTIPDQIGLQSNYQLNVEDALEISNFDTVIFVDATVEKDAQAPFQLREITAAQEISFSTHAMSMEGILALTDQLYGVNPKAFVLTMPGYQWEIVDKLSEKAESNLQEATKTVAHWIQTIFFN